MISQFGVMLLFILAAFAFIGGILLFGKLLRPDHPNEEKLTTYESGEEPVGNANIQFNPRFYIVALVFVLFDVELVFLFPWATVFAQPALITKTDGLWGWFTLAEAVVFVVILGLGLAYAWAKGYLDWEKPRPTMPNVPSNVPTRLYEQINERYANASDQ
jgi:NADH-quinone oxidoreductase subunit A